MKYKYEILCYNKTRYGKKDKVSIYLIESTEEWAIKKATTLIKREYYEVVTVIEENI